MELEVCLPTVHFLQLSCSTTNSHRTEALQYPVCKWRQWRHGKASWHLFLLCAREPSLIASKPKFSQGQSFEGWAHQTTASWPVLLLSEGAGISQLCWKPGSYHLPKVPQELTVEPAAETQRKFDYAALGRTKSWKFRTGKIWVMRWEVLGVTHSTLF